MTASLTLGSAAVDSTGKVLTATISGGTGTGYAITNATGINPHTVVAAAGNDYGLGVTSVSVVGSTLTVNLTTPFGTGETVRLDITTGSNLTDSGGNTPTGQTNLAVTNSSAVTVTNYIVTTNASVFELNLTGASLPLRQPSQDLTDGNNDNAPVEFVADCTEAAFYSYSGVTTKVATDGGTLGAVSNTNGFWGAKPLTTTPLASGKHLFRVKSDDYHYGVRLSGGARTMHAINTTKRPIVAASSAHYAYGQNTTTPCKVWGAWKSNDSTKGTINTSGNYNGFTVEVGFDGSGIELATVTANFSTWTASVDGGLAGALLLSGDSSMNGVNDYMVLASGLAPGAHTISAMNVNVGTTTLQKAVRAINGTATTVANSIGDTTVTVASVSTLAVNDWLRIDYYSKREWRQITGIAGNVITLNAALAKTHASGCAVTSYSAPAATLSTYQRKDLSAKRLAAMGDSNTAGANDYGASTTPDSNGVYYGLYDNRWSPMFLAADPLNIEVVNLGIQGETSTGMAARSVDFSTYAKNSYDYVTIFAGTNDINGTSTTPTTYQANLETLVTAAAAGLRTGGKIILIPPATPSGVTNAGGLNAATAKTACQAVAAAHPTTCVDGSSVLNGLIAGDLNGVHYHPSGQQKLATNLSALIGGFNALLGSGFFAA